MLDVRWHHPRPALCGEGYGVLVAMYPSKSSALRVLDDWKLKISIFRPECCQTSTTRALLPLRQLCLSNRKAAEMRRVSMMTQVHAYDDRSKWMTSPVCPNSRADIALECSIYIFFTGVCSNELEVFPLLRFYPPLRATSPSILLCVLQYGSLRCRI